VAWPGVLGVEDPLDGKIDDAEDRDPFAGPVPGAICPRIENLQEQFSLLPKISSLGELIAASESFMPPTGNVESRHSCAFPRHHPPHSS
jgi:hypothetical protein